MTVRARDSLVVLFPKEIEILVVGLSGSGKTSLIQALAGEEFRQVVVPTVGFANRKVSRRGLTVKVWDLGGQKRFRSMWHRYAGGVQAILFVVDASDPDSLPEANAELMSLIGAASQHAPLMLIANKSDKDEALSVEDVAQAVGMDMVRDREVAQAATSCAQGQGLDDVERFLLSHAA